MALASTSLRGHGVIAILEVRTLICSAQSRTTVLYALPALSASRKNAVARIPTDLIFVHILEVSYDLLLLLLAIPAKLLSRVLLCHSNVFLLKCIQPFGAARLRGIALTVAVVLVDAATSAVDYFCLYLVGFWQAEALGEEAATTTTAVLLSVVVALQGLVGVAVWCALLYNFAQKSKLSPRVKISTYLREIIIARIPSKQGFEEETYDWVLAGGQVCA